MKIQPINDDFPANTRVESSKAVLKSRLKRLLDRPFILKTSISDKSITAVSVTGEGGVTEFEPSSVVLMKMVQNYMEENNNNNEKQSKNGRNHRCNCFNGNNDSSDDESDGGGGSGEDDYDHHFTSLIPCESITEKNLLSETTKILEKKKIKSNDMKKKKKIVVDGLLSLGYDSSICKSSWFKTRSIPSGEYEYIDVIVKGERFIIDVDFRSEFEIARQTNGYKALIQSLPLIFVGKSDRIFKIVSLVSEAAKQSLKKKGMHLPPWRKADYMRAKWLSSSYTRISGESSPVVSVVEEADIDELVFEEKVLSLCGVPFVDGDDDDVAEPVKKSVTGLALLFKENP